MYSQFWHSSETAGPSMMDVARFWDREPRILRRQRRTQPPPLPPLSSPIRLTTEHTTQVAAFWRAQYRGADWWLDAEESWVQTVLSSPKNYVLGVFHNNTLVGTIVSRPAVGESENPNRSVGSLILLGEKGYIHDSRVIEGLCVDKAWRGKHLAGWLIAWIDYWTDRIKPTVHFWLREVPYTWIQTTELCAHVYGFVKTADLPQITAIQRPLPERMVFSEFQKLWQEAMYNWRSPTSFISTTPFSERGEEECWEVWKYQKWLIVIQNTRRKTSPENLPIWEVAWIGLEKTPGHRVESGEICRHFQSLVASPDLKYDTIHGSPTAKAVGDSHNLSSFSSLPGQYMPRTEEDPSPRSSLEAVAVCIADRYKKQGVLFGTDAPYQGGLNRELPTPWKFGTSGKHLTYIYNFMPPTFWWCSIHMPRLEL